ncbi:anti-sigma factor family protein, partial [Candidatus Halocynthiibacter alkanivorans]|uniref:anti-sigma factor family protein n=1 Tax=Candidatus Halocynthiibacter alkanivorans TaxID=2267619 RepID=UPI003AF3D567
AAGVLLDKTSTPGNCKLCPGIQYHLGTGPVMHFGARFRGHGAGGCLRVGAAHGLAAICANGQPVFAVGGVMVRRLDVAELARLSAPARPPALPLMARLAAALAVLALGLSLGWYSRGELASPGNSGDSMVQQALAAHAVFASDANRPVEIRGTEEALLLRWLSKRLGESLAAPDLRSQGYDLVGGRLLSVPDGPAALFMYEDATGSRITLFATRRSSDQMAEFRFENSDSARGFYWQDSRLAYAVIGDMSRKSLSTLATMIYKQLS